MESSYLYYPLLEQDMKLAILAVNFLSPHIRESGIRNPTFFCLWNPESGALESGIQSLESGIQPVESGIQPHPYLWNLGLECTTLLVVIT